MKSKFIFLAALMIFASVACAENATNSAQKIKIILVGDSTVNDGSGWGLGFKQFLNTNLAECINTGAVPKVLLRKAVGRMHWH